MIGYKKYNSLYDRWEYYDLKTNNSSNTGYQVQQPVSYGNLELASKVLNSKQAKYDYNLNKIQTYISECRKSLNSSDMDATLIQNIKDNFNAKYLLPFYKKGYDLSSDSTTNSIIDWLNEGLIATIKYESEKFNASNKPKDLKSLVGGYKVPVVEEQIFQNNTWITTKKEAWNAYLFFDSELLWFKRGDKKWTARKLSPREHNLDTKLYVYDSEQGVVALDDSFRYILFHDIKNKNIRYLYLIGDKDSSVIPTE